MTPIDTIAAAMKHARGRAGLSISELAKRAGVAKSTLSQLEAGSGNPSVETLWAIATALDLPVSALLEPPSRALTLIRAGEGPAIVSDQAAYVARLLSAAPTAARRDLFWLDVEPGGVRESEPHPPGTREHVVLCHGLARVGPPDAAVELGPGDYFAYPGDAPHIFEALEPGTKAVMVMESP